MASAGLVKWTFHVAESTNSYGIAQHVGWTFHVTEPPNSSTGKLRSLLSAKRDYWNHCRSLGGDNFKWTYLSTNCLHKNSPDKKTFICQSDTCGSVPRAYSAKRDRINPYQSPISNREKVRCPASTYIYSEARDRNPNKWSNLGVTQLYPGSQHC